MKNSGMTLIEVLVALAVFSVAAIALMKTVNQQTSGLSRLEEKTFANWVAENQLIQLRLDHVWPENRWTMGESEMADRRWYWRWRGVNTADARLRALDIEVMLSAPDATQTSPDVITTLRGYVVKP